MERPVKNWLSEHVAEVIYAVLPAIGNLAGLARLKSMHGKRLDKVESDLENVSLMGMYQTAGHHYQIRKGELSARR
jgi:hypothetical protein